jgi:hypothetical protein
MLLAIGGSLFVLLAGLAPGLVLKKRKKWKLTTAACMAVGGFGPIGFVMWLFGLVTSPTWRLILGAAAFVALLGALVAVAADLFPDKKIDNPWTVFFIPSLLTAVLLTGDTTLPFLGRQIESNANTIVSRVETGADAPPLPKE